MATETTRKMVAQYNSTCACCGRLVKSGAWIVYNYSTRQTVHDPARFSGCAPSNPAFAFNAPANTLVAYSQAGAEFDPSDGR